MKFFSDPFIGSVNSFVVKINKAVLKRLSWAFSSCVNLVARLPESWPCSSLSQANITNISTSGLYFVFWTLAARCYKTQCASSPLKIQHASRRHLTWQVTIQPGALSLSNTARYDDNRQSILIAWFIVLVTLTIHLVSRWHEIWTLISVIDPLLHTTQYTLIVPTAICECKECISSELSPSIGPYVRYHAGCHDWLIINTWHTVTIVTKFVAM